MNLPRVLLVPGLIALLCACAVQNAESGFGNEEEDAGMASDDGKIPAFDVPVVDPDTGAEELDVGMMSVDPDVRPSDPDTGVAPRPDVSVARDVSLARDVPLVRDVGVTTPDVGMSVACSARTSCAACTAEATCGWCGATSRCSDGTAAGPVGATCATGWAWIATACVAPVDPCARYTQCGDCAAAAACGWCRSSRRCMTGASTGPNPTYGTCESWAYVASACTTPGDPCASSRGCGSCTDRGSCGWCGDSSTCHSGSSGGPTDGACRSGDWTWTNFLGICSPF